MTETNEAGSIVEMALNKLRNEVAVIFRQTTLPVVGPHGGVTAKSLAENQTQYHKAFFQNLVRQLSDFEEISKVVRNFSSNYVEAVLRSAPFSVHEVGNVPHVSHIYSVPILESERKVSISPPESLDNAFRNRYIVDAVAIVLTGYVRATRFAEAEFDPKVAGALSAAFFSELVQKEAVPTALVEKLQGDAIEASLHFDRLKAGMVKTREDLGALQAIVSNSNELRDFLREQETKIRAAANDATLTLEARRKAIDEALKLSDAKRLWNDEAKSATTAFRTSFVVLIATLAAIPVSALIWRDDIVTFLRTMEVAMVAGASGDSQVAATISALGRLVLITAPLGFVIWLLRLIVRFNTRSLLLMDDARLRVTVLNTYLFLIEQNAAVKEDRGALLEALFRRPPGHGDTADPPSFVDLMKYGQDTAPKG